MSAAPNTNPAAVMQRIEQFRKMADADPTNELGHFSLGRALLDAGMHADAVASFRRVIELNANLSKAYQLLASAQAKTGDQAGAVATLTKGVEVAHSRGDMMPKTEMIAELKRLGAAVPELKGGPATTAVGEGQIQCTRCGQVKPKMASAPFRAALGQEIHQKVCAECWREWIGMGTKVINEMRLPLADPQAQKIYDSHMVEFLNLRGQQS